MARVLIVEDNPELASLVASAAQARGHTAMAVHTGKDALIALVSGQFDGAIVDLLLPDLRGGEILDELSRRRIPAIAVSGVYKGDRFAREAVDVHGAREFFEKPFAMSAVLEALEAATGSKPTPQSESDDELPELELYPEEEEEELRISIDEAPTPRAGTPRRTEESLPLPFEHREKVWAEATKPAPRSHRSVTRTPESSGTIQPGTVAKLLTAYYQARHSGELRLQQDKVLKVVYFEAGRPAYAISNVATERFARFCEKKGILSKTQLEAVNALSKQKRIRAAEEMLRVGLLTFEKRVRLVEEQIREIIGSTFSWETGSYSFARKRLNRAGWVDVSLFPGNLILEGVLRAERLQSLRQRMSAGRRMFPTADPPYALNELALSGPQAMLLAYADGTKTVEDLTALSDLSEREALATLLALELMGLIEERREDGKQRRISYGL